MKRQTVKILCVVVAACLLLQVQPVYAAQNMPETVQTQEADSSENQDQDQNLKDPQDENQNPNEDLNADDENKDEEEVEEKVPSALKGLCTTAQSGTKVRLAWKASKNAAQYVIYRKPENGKYHKLGESCKTFYLDSKIEKDRIYQYKVVPVNQGRKEGKAATISFNNKTIVKIPSQKYTYEKMKNHMTALKKKYSDYCEMNVLGTSVKGRNIYDFAIGNPNAKKSILVVGTLHAREYISVTVLMREIEYYLSNYNNTIGGIKPAEALKNTQIHYIVMANPDGVTISQNTHARWKANARGVDLNRNFPTDKFIVGGKPGAEGYSGKKALSEPESQAVADLTKRLKKEQGLCGVVNYHAMGRIIYGSCLTKGIYKDTKTMYRIAKKETGYQDAISSNKKSTGGQYREYVMYMLGIPSITIEVGKTWAPCAYSDYETEFQKNKHVVLKIVNAIGK